MLILDEDMEGTITLHEYFNALEAYGVAGEPHFDPDGGDNYVPFDNRALFKLVSIMKQRNLGTQDVFNACDTSGDGAISLHEFEQFLSSMSSEFSQKEIHSIHKFFDVDSNGICEEREFKAQMKKAERTFSNHKKSDAGKGARPQSAAVQGLGVDLSSTQNTRKNNFMDSENQMNDYIKGYDSLTPEAKTQMIVTYLNEELRVRKLMPGRVFAMADSGRTNSVKFQECLKMLAKMIPDLSYAFLNELPIVFQLGEEQFISKSDFEMLFADQYNQRPPSPVKKNKISRNPRLQQEAMAILKFIAELFKSKQITSEDVFTRVDRRFGGVLTVYELKEGIKAALGQEAAAVSFKKVEMALDVNQTGEVTRQEFVSLMSNAAVSIEDTSSYYKILESLKTGHFPKKEVAKKQAKAAPSRRAPAKSEKKS